jgi:protein-tyrosine phosphatase
VVEDDFLHYDKIIALSKKEHQPMLISRFNGHHVKVSYFEVGDLPLEDPAAAMNKLSGLVEELIEVIA